LVVEIPNVFEFDNLNNALQFSKEDKRKVDLLLLGPVDLEMY